MNNFICIEYLEDEVSLVVNQKKIETLKKQVGIMEQSKSHRNPSKDRAIVSGDSHNDIISKSEDFCDDSSGQNISLENDPSLSELSQETIDFIDDCRETMRNHGIFYMNYYYAT